MGQGRRQFTDEFKREAVALLASSGRPLTQIASELGIAPSMLRNWRNHGGGRNAGSALRLIPAPAPHSAPDSALEISRLRRENDRLRMERDILKNSSRGFVPPVAVETGALAWPWRGAAVSFMVAMTPSKNVAPGLLRT
jgi:transposase